MFFVFLNMLLSSYETVVIICHSRDLPRPILISLFDDKVRYQDKLNLHFPYFSICPVSSMLVAWKTNLPRKVGHVLVTLWPPHLFLVPAKDHPLIDHEAPTCHAMVHCLKIWQTPIASPRKFRHHIHVTMEDPGRMEPIDQIWPWGWQHPWEPVMCPLCTTKLSPNSNLENVPKCWWLNPPNPLEKKWKRTYIGKLNPQ